MGNCNQTTYKSIGNVSDWQQIHRYEYSVVLKNPTQTQCIQKWASLEIENPNIYAWRMKNYQKSMPNIRQLAQEVLPIYCHSKKNETIKGSVVYTDVYTPLSKVQSLTSGECALLIRTVLPGLKSLCEKFGWFSITSENIFINQDGQATIWIHPNISVNKLREKLTSKEWSQQKVIQVLIKIVKQKMEPQQILELPKDGVNFKKADTILKDFLSQYAPNLGKIYLDRAQYNLSEQRKQYRVITYHSQQIKQSNDVVKQRIITRTDSTSPSQKLGFKSNQIHPSYISTKHISQASGAFEKYKDEKAKETQLKNSKDPDQLLYELIQEYNL